jgi:hypothetical protein
VHRDRDDRDWPGGQVAADDPDAEGRAHGREAPREPFDPRRRQVGGSDERDHEGGRPRPHRRDVREVLSGRPTAHVLTARPAPAEVAVLDQHVGRDDHAAVRRGHDRGVVPGWDQRGVAERQLREDQSEQGILGQVGDGRLVWEAHVRHRIPSASGLRSAAGRRTDRRGTR